MRFGGVEEFAKEHGRSRQEIYRLISEGRIQAQKISGAYVIDLDQGYPEDKRYRSGKYVNWRKK